MAIFQRVLALFLLSLSVARANFEPSQIKITQQSTLEELNRELKVFRDENPNMKPAEVNDHALAVLDAFGHLQDDIFSQIDTDIDRGYYAHLQSLYPATKMIWWNDYGLALLLAKAFGRTEWMSGEEWEGHSKGIDWELRFRSLIRSGNENVYKSLRFKDLIFKNKIFRRYFREIIQEAYDSKNFAFLSAVPYPDDEYPLDVKDALFFWSLAYKRAWSTREWDGYINSTTEDVKVWLKRLEIFQCDNPKVFESERVQEALGHVDKEPLKTAIEFDSLSFAQYLKEMFGPEEFSLMAEKCSEVHTFGRTLSRGPFSMTNRYVKGQLSRVYDLLSKSGRKLDASEFEFGDLSFMDRERFKDLLDGGFSKGPSSDNDIYQLGQTETGIEFLKKILKGEYKVGGKPLDLTLNQLSTIELEILDVEAFRLIDGKLSTMAEKQRTNLNLAHIGEYEAWEELNLILRVQKEFREKCARVATKKGDVKFLSGILSLSITISSISKMITDRVIRGDLVVLDWIFEANPKLLEEFEWTDSKYYCSSAYVPLLKYLFKKLPPSTFLAKYRNEHLLRAAKEGDKDHYNQVIAIEGSEKVMGEYGFGILKVPEERIPEVSIDFSNVTITSQSTLEEVNEELGRLRNQLYKDHPNVGLIEANNHLLTVLVAIGYYFENDILSLIDEAIKEGYYEFLWSLYPTSLWAWWDCDDDVALFLAKAFGRIEWMGEAEWEEYSKDVDWELRIQALIRSGNENIYKSERFRDLILNNQIFQDSFKEIMQEAYDSKNFALLCMIPVPKDLLLLGDYFTHVPFFWTLTYGRVPCLEEGWSDFVGSKMPDDVLKFWPIFEADNPKVFGCERIQEFLKSMGIQESLKTAIEFDSLSYAQYLKEKLKPEEFQSMVTNCSEIHTYNRQLQGFPDWSCKHFDRRLSQVYNLLLDNGRDIKRDIDSIELPDVLILKKKYLQILLNGGFNKRVPPGQWPKLYAAFKSYGTTKIGIEFLKKILKGEYKVNGETVTIPYLLLTRIKLEIFDIEAIELIDDKLSQSREELKKFRGECMRLAVENGNTEYLAKVELPPSVVVGHISTPVFKEVIEKGNLKVLEWMLKAKPEWLEGLEWSNYPRSGYPSDISLLRYLFKKSSPQMPLARYAKKHFQMAIDIDREHYDHVMAIEGITEVMKNCGIEIPNFSQEE